MKKQFTALFLIILTFCSISFAFEYDKNANPENLPTQRQARIDEMVGKRLNLSDEQWIYIKQERIKDKEKIHKIIEKMQQNHDKIRQIYQAESQHWIADLKTATLKAELVNLKKEAEKIKKEGRRKFIDSLTQEQKLEFEKMKQEFHLKRTNK